MRKIYLTMLLVILAVVTIDCYGQQNNAYYPPLIDTLKATTSTQGYLIARPSDTTFGKGSVYSGRTVVTSYDSIVVDTVGGKWKNVYILTADASGNAADSIIVETWDATYSRWVQVGLRNLTTNADAQLICITDNTNAVFKVNEENPMYIRRRLVNAGAAWVANRTSLQTLKFSNN